MSLIRCLSNPECLYIVDSGDVITVYQDADFTMYIPSNTFYKAAARFDGIYEDPVRYRGMTLESIQVYRKSGRVVPKKVIEADDKAKNPLKRILKRAERDYKIRMSYKGQSVIMWQVTWAYIKDHPRVDKEFKEWIKEEVRKEQEKKREKALKKGRAKSR